MAHIINTATNQPYNGKERKVKMPQIVVMQESGETVYEGSLHAFIVANEEYPGNLIACLRDGMTQPHGRPEPAVITRGCASAVVGGGAAPLFYVSLTD